jgi:hypothetical protein
MRGTNRGISADETALRLTTSHLLRSNPSISQVRLQSTS